MNIFWFIIKNDSASILVMDSLFISYDSCYNILLHKVLLVTWAFLLSFIMQHCYLTNFLHRDDHGHHDHESYYGDRDTDTLVTVRTNSKQNWHYFYLLHGQYLRMQLTGGLYNSIAYQVQSGTCLDLAFSSLVDDGNFGCSNSTGVSEASFGE